MKRLGAAVFGLMLAGGTLAASPRSENPEGFVLEPFQPCAPSGAGYLAFTPGGRHMLLEEPEDAGTRRIWAVEPGTRTPPVLLTGAAVSNEHLACGGDALSTCVGCRGLTPDGGSARTLGVACRWYRGDGGSDEVRFQGDWAQGLEGPYSFEVHPERHSVALRSSDNAIRVIERDGGVSPSLRIPELRWVTPMGWEKQGARYLLRFGVSTLPGVQYFAGDYNPPAERELLSALWDPSTGVVGATQVWPDDGESRSFSPSRRHALDLDPRDGRAPVLEEVSSGAIRRPKLPERVRDAVLGASGGIPASWAGGSRWLGESWVALSLDPLVILDARTLKLFYPMALRTPVTLESFSPDLRWAVGRAPDGSCQLASLRPTNGAQVPRRPYPASWWPEATAE
ncbi:hypothetical protein [Myxococcus sp. CA040A]|uniref:hypothetical protein n=1 Tax=Myxococcus sp. CA040A TaxID=2741738 RepID=UPI00157A3B47|nr:hypothetical protein [Myxococcus sp. CA040A]NTX01068.1 hypothetical protein [Myxococcus sp. CA040A]